MDILASVSFFALALGVLVALIAEWRGQPMPDQAPHPDE
jgi:hypothetical protein